MRERWRNISDSLKLVYVTLARFEQELDNQSKVQAFFAERIETAKAHASLSTNSKSSTSSMMKQ